MLVDHMDGITRERKREREEGPVIDGKLNGRMDGGLTFGRPLNSNLFIVHLPGGPVNFNIRTDATALAIERQDLKVQEGWLCGRQCDNPRINSTAAGFS